MKKIILVCICVCLLTVSAFAQNNAATQVQPFGEDFVQGLEAYRVGEWDDALFFLKRTSQFQNATSDAVWYFVIMAEVHIGDYTAVLRDGTMFLSIFNNSSYTAEITYQTLYASFEQGLYNQSVSGFASFIQDYPNHAMIPNALYFTGEALYNVYEFTKAKTYYDTIIVNYPNSDKYDSALFRIELLKQREREEKLLYLLRVTGEEAVAAKEDYERQIKQLQSEESLLLSKRVQELEQDIGRLQVEKQELVIQNETLKNTVQDLNTVIAENAKKVVEPEIIEPEPETQDNSDLISSLSEKAIELEKLLGEE